MSNTIPSPFGPLRVAHRLALGLECLDALSDRRITHVVTAAYRPLKVSAEAGPRAWQQMARSGSGRFVLLHGRVPSDITLQVDDPARRYLPRRLSVHLWEMIEVAEPAPYVPVTSRVLRVWLHPASAYSFPRTATVLRGRVVRQGVPERRAHVVATGPGDVVVGRTWTDDRGEFLLPVTDTGQKPVRDTVTVTLVIRAPRQPAARDDTDPGADLVVDDVPRSSNPATAAELDNEILRGIAVPAGYVHNIAPSRRESVPVGAEHILTRDVEFAPEP